MQLITKMENYISIIAPIIAIINSVIAVYVAQFKPEERRVKITLLVVAISLGVLAAAATLWSQYYANEKTRVTVERKLQIRINLANYINRANKILIRLNNTEDKDVIGEADKWYWEASDYIENNLGPDYTARFNDISNLSTIIPNTLISNPSRLHYWQIINYRDSRLVQFSSEFLP